MTVFAPFAAATEPLYALRLSYATDILRSEDGTEQRVQLRVIPKREESYLARTIKPASTGWLDALTYGGMDELLTVPYWPHGTTLGAAASAGSNVVLSVATTDRDFAVNGRVVLWGDEGQVEETTAEGVTSSTVTADLVNSWGSGTFVFPAKRGRYTGDLSLSRLAAMMAEVPVTFEMEHGSDPGVSTPSTPAVFTVVPYIRRDVTHDMARPVDRIESATYTYQDFRTRERPIGVRPFRVWLASRAAVNSLIAWFHGIKGRLAPFWLPTYQQDFEILSGLGTASLTIRRCGYTAWMFPDESRRHLACIAPSGAVTHREITAATDNGAGANTETLTLDGTAPSNTSLVSYLLLGRLESDTLEIRWRHNSFADCAMGFVELPAEVPQRTGGATPGAGVSASPNTGTPIFTALAPSVVLTTIPILAGVGAGTFTGLIPTVVTATVSPAAGLGAPTFTGFAPSATITVFPAPAAGQSVFTGLAPSIAQQMPGAGDVTVTGLAPTVIANATTASAGVGVTSVVGYKVRVQVRSGFAGAAVGILEVAGHAPFVTIGGAGLGQGTFTGFAPTV